VEPHNGVFTVTQQSRPTWQIVKGSNVAHILHGALKIRPCFRDCSMVSWRQIFFCSGRFIPEQL